MGMREMKFQFTVICTGEGRADDERVESMIDLAMQDLVYDDEFIAALDEKEAVTIQVSRIG
jgi:hypothetical protein